MGILSPGAKRASDQNSMRIKPMSVSDYFSTDCAGARKAFIDAL